MTDEHDGAAKAGESRAAMHVAAGHRLMRQLAASRQARRQRIMLAVLGGMSAITLLASGSAWMLTSYVSSSLHRVNAGTSGTPTSGPVNILVAGVDTRGGLTRREEIKLHVGDSISSNSDTLMLVHVPADHRSVQVVSLPRDSWVNIPGHGMNKINAAFGIGGPQLMVKTVEQATGMTINDYIAVDFLGFVKVIDALGGVNVCVPFAVDDSQYSGLHLAAGEHHVDGVTALEFARDRHSFAASDLARISDQQQLLSSMLAQATQTGVLADPIRLQQFLSSITAAVQVDKGFDLIRLFDEMRGISPSDISFTTVPIATASYITPTGEEAILWDSSAAKALFTWLNKDTGAARPASSRAKDHLSRSQVSLDIYNGTLVGGLSASTGTQLAAAGFTVHKSGLNWPQHTIAKTLVEYPPGQAAAASLVAKALPGSETRVVTGLPRVTIVLGTADHTVTAKPQPAASSSKAPGQQRTAAQDACH